jgi:hypothetical protein
MARARLVAPALRSVAGLGLSAAAKALNERGIRTPTGSAAWTAEMVKRTRARIERIEGLSTVDKLPRSSRQRIERFEQS